MRRQHVKGEQQDSGDTAKAAQSDPQKAFTDALAKSSQSKNTALTLKFTSTEAELSDFGKADPKFGLGNDPKRAHYLATSSITIRTKDQSTAVDVIIDGKPVIQVIGSKGAAYFRADVPQLEALAGSSTTTKLNQLTTSLPPGFEFVKDALAGKWLQVDGTALKALGSFAQPRTGASATPSLNPTSLSALQARITSVLGADLTAVNAGSTDKGEHLVLTGNSKKLVTDLLQPYATLPGVGSTLTRAETQSVPDKDIKIDAYFADRGLTAISVNLAQFSDQPAAQGMSIPLEISFSDPSDISIPKDTTKIDTTKLITGFSSLLTLPKASAPPSP